MKEYTQAKQPCAFVTIIREMLKTRAQERHETHFLLTYKIQLKFLAHHYTRSVISHTSKYANTMNS